MKEKVRKLWKKFMFRFPVQLPVGNESLISFCDQLFDTYDLPNHPSYHHAVATMILQQSPVTDRMPPSFFARSIRKAMANEVAFARIQELKKMDKDERPKEDLGSEA